MALSIVTDVLSSTPSLSEHLDEDTTEYILSILADDPSDEDAREAVSAFIQGHDIEEDVCQQFFSILDAALKDNGGGIANGVGSLTIGTVNNDENALPRKLDSAITLKAHDIQTFASGLVAEKDSCIGDEDGVSDIQTFYANMIDVSNHPRAKSGEYIHM